MDTALVDSATSTARSSTRATHIRATLPRTTPFDATPAISTANDRAFAYHTPNLTISLTRMSSVPRKDTRLPGGGGGDLLPVSCSKSLGGHVVGCVCLHEDTICSFRMYDTGGNWRSGPEQESRKGSGHFLLSHQDHGTYNGRSHAEQKRLDGFSGVFKTVRIRRKKLMGSRYFAFSCFWERDKGGRVRRSAHGLWDMVLLYLKYLDTTVNIDFKSASVTLGEMDFLLGLRQSRRWPRWSVTMRSLHVPRPKNPTFCQWAISPIIMR